MLRETASGGLLLGLDLRGLELLFQLRQPAVLDLAHLREVLRALRGFGGLVELLLRVTLGLGDLSPVGTVRLLAGMESLTGLLLITWSASFTYLEMSRVWACDDSE